MIYKRITVHTREYEAFSDLFAEIAGLTLGNEEEQSVSGIKISNEGDVDDEYIRMMRKKPEVAVMRVRGQETVILQHGGVFEILLPAPEATLA